MGKSLGGIGVEFVHEAQAFEVDVVVVTVLLAENQTLVVISCLVSPGRTAEGVQVVEIVSV